MKDERQKFGENGVFRIQVFDPERQLRLVAQGKGALERRLPRRPHPRGDDNEQDNRCWGQRGQSERDVEWFHHSPCLATLSDGYKPSVTPIEWFHHSACGQGRVARPSNKVIEWFHHSACGQGRVARPSNKVIWWSSDLQWGEGTGNGAS